MLLPAVQPRPLTDKTEGSGQPSGPLLPLAGDRQAFRVPEKNMYKLHMYVPPNAASTSDHHKRRWAERSCRISGFFLG
jgi:hypothetical protein